MRRVIIESPYAGDIELNVAYARACLEDSIMRSEAPFASHLLYTQVLDDSDEFQRTLGIDAGLAWYYGARIIAFYIDLGWSSGMRAAHIYAESTGKEIDERRLPPDKLQKVLEKRKK